MHEGGLGERWLGGPPPDADTVFRIASMTKNFTAAAVLALRDEGALRLDDPVADFVPELRGLRPVTGDGPAITIRHLLTMTAGFPTDDPWGDRQQGLPLAEFAALLRRGIRAAWPPGTCFEYSNLGYALLGRVIAAAAQADYAEFVTARVLRPLGLDRTSFETAAVDPSGLARGYQRRPDGWAELVPDGYGAFAPMGGIFSCVRDLARWASGFAAAFPAGAEATGGPHPLRRATRREMQLPQVTIAPQDVLRLPGDPAAGVQHSYGFGLFIEESPAWGRIVQHSGGYPGFGSHMRWHPETGLAVIVLANSTYAAAHTLGVQLMEAVLQAGEAAAGPAADGGAGPRARRAVAGDASRAAGGGPAHPVLGRPGGRADLHRERRPGRALRAAPGQGRAAVAAPWATARPEPAPGRIRLSRALPLVAAWRARRCRGRDPADAGGPAPGPVAGARRAAGPGFRARPGHRSHCFFAERRCPGLACRPAGVRVRRPRSGPAPAADGQRLGRTVPGRCAAQRERADHGRGRAGRPARAAQPGR